MIDDELGRDETDREADGRDSERSTLGTEPAPSGDYQRQWCPEQDEASRVLAQRRYLTRSEQEGQPHHQHGHAELGTFHAASIATRSSARECR